VPKPTLTGIHHVALNVRDLDASARWYQDVLDFSVLLPWDTEDFDRRIMGHPSGVYIALTRHKHPDADAEFSERRPGLDHLALGVASVDELQAWISRLDAAGVRHGGIQVTPSTGFTLVAFKDPDGIQLELYLA
jgi:glyoxylase I family protein